MILGQVNLVVADMEATVGFYRQLGLEIPDTLPEWQAHHRTAVLPGGIDLDLDSVEFAAQWNRGARSGPGSAVIGFRVESRDEVDRLHAVVAAAGHPVQEPPHDTFWGSRYAIVEDPDGQPVGLMSPPDPERATAPPPPPGA